MWQTITATLITKLGSPKEYDMKRCLLVIALTLFVHTIAINNSMAQPSGPSQIPTLSPTGVPKGPPEKILLKNSVIHIQINDLNRLLNDVNDLIMSFVPEKAVPEQFKPFLKYEKPVLAFLGINSAGKPLTSKTLADISGIDARRPLSLTFYLGGNPVNFILSVPMAEGQTLSRMLMNITLPRTFTKEKLGKTTYYHIKPSKHDMSENLYVVCSEDYAYICSSAQLASALANAEPEHRLSPDGAVATMTKDYSAKDLTVCMNPQIFKLFLPGLKHQFGRIQPGQIASLRKSLLEGMSDSDRLMLDLRVKTELGLQDTDELLDYVECFATATYETVASRLFNLVENLEGAGIALDLDKQFQSIEYACYSSDINPMSTTRPIPMTEALQGILLLPGELHNLTISGKEPRRRQSRLAQQWARLLQKKLLEKQLSSKAMQKLIHMVREYRPEQDMKSIADWTVSTQVEKFDLPETSEFEGMLDYLAALNKTQFTVSPAMILPAKKNTLQQYFQARVADLNSNILDAANFHNSITDKEPFLDQELSLRQNSLNGNITLFSLENKYTTTLGMFGYDEHELINRKIYACRQLNNYLLIQPGRGPYEWIKGKRLRDVTKPDAAVSKLLSLAPAKANTIAVVRGMHIFPTTINLLNDLEKLWHRDLDSYLASARKTLSSNDKEQIKELAARMPMVVKSLNRDSASGKLYLVLPGKLTYPRPAIMPAISALFKDFRSKMDKTGGGMSWSRALPGRIEGGMIHNTGGISCLFQTVIDNFYAEYQSSPEGRVKLQKLLQGKHGAGISEDKIILKHPLTYRKNAQ